MTTDKTKAFASNLGRYSHTGMDLRDYFAAQLIPALLETDVAVSRENDEPPFSPADLAKLAYEYADAMMEARRSK